MCQTCLSRTRTGRGPCFPFALPFGYTVVSQPPPCIKHIPLGRLLPLRPFFFMNVHSDVHADTHSAWTQEENQCPEDLVCLPMVQSLGKWGGSSICVPLPLTTSLGPTVTLFGCCCCFSTTCHGYSITLINRSSCFFNTRRTTMLLLLSYY